MLQLTQLASALLQIEVAFKPEVLLIIFAFHEKTFDFF